jgi:hypothetical protein
MLNFSTFSANSAEYVGIIKGCASMRSARYGNSYCFFYSGISSPSIIALLILLGVSTAILVLYR